MDHSILFTDIKHCKADLADQITKDYQEDVDLFLRENKTINDDFYDKKMDCNDMTISEFLFYSYWSEFVDFVRERYEWQV